MANKYVHAAYFQNLPSAHIASGMLEANGITAKVESQTMGSIYGSTLTWAPIEILVPEPDLERALQLLEEHRDN